MIFLECVEFKKDYRCFKQGDKIDTCKDMVLLVGDQGTGKSSLINCIIKPSGIVHLTQNTEVEKVRYKHFDTEHHNPRIQSAFSNEHFMQELCSKFVSHGQVILPIMESCEDSNNLLIIIDEPESGLSLRSQYRLLEVFKNAINNNCQVILSTHSIPIIEGFGEVFDLETKTWKSADEFLEGQKKLKGVKRKTKKKAKNKTKKRTKEKTRQ